MTKPLFRRLALLLTLLPTPAAAEDLSAAAAGVKQIVAHRGSSVDRPENTLASARRAMEVGATAIEVDVRTTRDGQLVLSHDATLDRATDGRGAIGERTLAEIKQLDAGRRFDPRFAGERVPTLAEILAVCRGKIDVLLDLKETGDQYAQRVAATVREAGDPQRIIVGVRSVEQAREFRTLFPAARQIGLIGKPDEIEAYVAAGVETIRLWPKWLGDETFVERVHKSGAKLHLNEADATPDTLREFLKHRPASISGDDPGQLVAALAALRGPASKTTAKTNAPSPLVDGTTEEHVMIPMRDGVRLSAYLYKPVGAGPWPVLYQQRYADITGAAARKSHSWMASQGYVVCVESFRGAQQSVGEFDGYRSLGWGERQDGYDTVEWLAAQPWSTGKIGTFGGSQGGYAQNFLAVAEPPHLVCQYMIDTGLSLFHEGYRIGGAARPGRLLAAMGSTANEPDAGRRWMERMLAHPKYDDYWADEDCTQHFDRMNVPCFTIGSWYDFMCTGSVQSFVGRQHRGGSNSRDKQQLLIGPWPHGSSNKATLTVGDLTYPAQAAFDVEQHMIRWFDHFLKGADNHVEREPTVRYFVMGALGEDSAPGNVWRDAPDFPPPADDLAYYLQADGRLNNDAPPADASHTSYRSDPANPAPIPGRSFPGARDARDYENHADVRTFTTEQLAEPVEWTGLVRAELYASSTAPDADFIVRVSDVYPDGRSILLVDMVQRARYRDGFDKEVPLPSGEPVKLTLNVGWLSQIFNRGHRIRVTIGSTGAEFYEPNPQTGGPITIDPPARVVVAENAIYHERTHASRILAPRPK